MQLLKVTSVDDYDKSLQYRSRINEATVMNIANSIETHNDIRKPLIVGQVKDKGRFLLAGFHRLAAAKLKKLDKVPVQVINFETYEEAQAFALADNIGSTESSIVDVARSAYNLNQAKQDLSTVIGLPSWCKDDKLYYHNLVRFGLYLFTYTDLEDIVPYLNNYETKSPQWYMLCDLEEVVIKNVIDHYKTYQKSMSDKQLKAFIHNSGYSTKHIEPTREYGEGFTTSACINCYKASVIQTEFMGQVSYDVQCYDLKCNSLKTMFTLKELQATMEDEGYTPKMVVKNDSAFNMFGEDYLKTLLTPWTKVSAKSILAEDADCQHAEQVAVIDGDNQYFTTICRNKKCMVHGKKEQDLIVEDKTITKKIEALRRKMHNEFDYNIRKRFADIVEKNNYLLMNTEKFRKSGYITLMKVLTTDMSLNREVKAMLDKMQGNTAVNEIILNGCSLEEIGEYISEKDGADYNGFLDKREQVLKVKIDKAIEELVANIDKKNNEINKFYVNRVNFINGLSKAAIEYAVEDDKYKDVCKKLGLNHSKYKTVAGRIKLQKLLNQLVDERV